jgi:hypothetical protein
MSMLQEFDTSLFAFTKIDFGSLGPYLWQCDMCDSQPQPRLWLSVKESTFCKTCEISSIGAIETYN